MPCSPSQCCGKNVTLKPTNITAHAALPAHSARSPPGHLREPVVQPGEHREHDAADEHVVEVGDHEERVVGLQSHGADATMIPVMPPSTKMKKNPATNHIGAVHRGRPSQIVAIQANTWMPDGMAMK
jgi:hypothetical protein